MTTNNKLTRLGFRS